MIQNKFNTVQTNYGRIDPVTLLASEKSWFDLTYILILMITFQSAVKKQFHSSLGH